MSTVFFDVDTQLDFVYPAGALYVPGAERVLPAVEKLNRYAAGHGLPVISTTDAHAENDPEFRVWPPHCVRGTFGQRKAPGTLLENRLVVAPERGDYSAGGGIRQIILQKQPGAVAHRAAGGAGAGRGSEPEGRRRAANARGDHGGRRTCYQRGGSVRVSQPATIAAARRPPLHHKWNSRISSSSTTRSRSTINPEWRPEGS